MGLWLGGKVAVHVDQLRLHELATAYTHALGYTARGGDGEPSWGRSWPDRVQGRGAAVPREPARTGAVAPLAPSRCRAIVAWKRALDSMGASIAANGISELAPRGRRSA